jgi:uncharacterized membrane protein YvbJ
VSETSQRFCIHCGAALEGAERFCTSCGVEVDCDEVQAAPAAGRRLRRRRRRCGWGLRPRVMTPIGECARR